MLSGLTAGAVAGIVAVLVSLPLRSPSAVLFNSLTVCLAALLAGALAGVIWWVCRRFQRPTLYFFVVWSAIFLPVTAVVVLAGRTQLDNFVTFALPLALIIYALTGLLTVGIPALLPRFPWRAAVGAAAGAIVVALALGFGLITQTDQESGRLELPPPGSYSVPNFPSPSTGEG